MQPVSTNFNFFNVVTIKHNLLMFSVRLSWFALCALFLYFMCPLVVHM